MIGATILLLVAWIVIPRLHRRSAAERHLCWAASLGAAAAMPLLAQALPPWRPEWAGHVAAVLPSLFDAGQAWTTSDRADVVVRAIGVEGSFSTAAGVWPWVWAAGAAFAILELAVQAAALARLAAKAHALHDERIAGVAADTARALGVERPIRILQTRCGAVPVTWGLRRPTIVLPCTASDWSDDRARAVIAHEMAHVRRGDWAVHLAADVICRLYWFHPLFWIGRSRLWGESERAADDVVLSLGVTGVAYADDLLAIVRAARSEPLVWSTTVAMARRSQLEGRFAALLNGAANRRPATRWRLLMAATLVLFVAVPLASVSIPRAAPGIAIKMTNLPAIVEPSPVLVSAPNAPAVKSLRVVDAADASHGSTPPAIAEYTTPPLYSEEARNRRIEGTVTVSAIVEPDGRVTGARVVRGLGSGLDENALVALRQWKFRPGARAGRPVPMRSEIDVEFSLRNEAVNAVVANDMATRVGPGITPPRLVRTFGLWKPGSSRRGTVVLDVILEEDGTPKVVRILQSLEPELDEAAVGNFSQWRFSPALKNGRPVKVRLNAEVTFHG
jgi:TonB family protein